MTLGYQCDADCENLADQAFGTITLDLDALPTMQGLQLAFTFQQQGIISMDDAEYMALVQALQGNASFDRDLPTVELHLCAGHTLTILDQMGVADIPQEPEGDVQATLDGAEQQS